jgi:menaquinone-dependent protoporphyrinogen oxidase
MTIQLLYSTAEGQARRIAERIAADLRDDGFYVQCEDVSSAVMLRKPDAVVLIASVHVGKHAAVARTFVKTNLPLFNNIPAAFMSVSLSASEIDRTRARTYVDAFLNETGWKPGLTATVAGALRYTNYNFLKKLIIKRIAQQNGLPTDTSRDHEFTDWNEVGSFVNAFVGSTQELAAR